MAETAMESAGRQGAISGANRNISGAPRKDYIGEHGFLAIPIEPAYLPGVRDLARFINGEDVR